MAKHRVSVQRASEDELAGVAGWFRQAAILNVPDDEFNARHVAAYRAGVLGAALGHRTLVEVYGRLEAHRTMEDRILARTLILSARLDDTTVGMLSMSPSLGALRGIGKAFSDSPDSAHMGYLSAIIMLSKLDFVAVSANHRGRGHGARLVRNAVEVARKSLIGQVFGQFRDQGLASFYEQLGFSVLSPGESLPISVGFQVSLAVAADETMFSKTLPLGTAALPPRR